MVTLKLNEPTMLAFPMEVRDPVVPAYIWNNLVSTMTDEGVRFSVGNEVYAFIPIERLQGPGSLVEGVVAQIRRHYLIVHKPELLIC